MGHLLSTLGAVSVIDEKKLDKQLTKSFFSFTGVMTGNLLEV